MTKHFYCLIAFFLINLAQSQTEKGNMFIGGSFNLSSNSKKGNTSVIDLPNENKKSNYSIIPAFGYFLVNNFAIGIEVGYSVNKETSLLNTIESIGTSSRLTEIDNFTKNKLFNAALFCKKFIPINDKLSFFANSSLGYSSGKIEVANSIKVNNTQFSDDLNFPPNPTYSIRSSYDASLKSYGIIITPGLAYFPYKRLSIEATFGNIKYIHTSESNEFYKSSGNDFGVTANLSTLFIGMNYYFR
jgi:hypothetical protein